MSKNKKRIPILLLILIMLVAGVLYAGFGKVKETYATPTVAQAAVYSAGGTSLSVSTQTALETKMKSKYFTHGGKQYHISEYMSRLHGTGTAMSWNSNKGELSLTFSQTDPITSLIPFAVFDELKTATSPYWCMGEQWGVIIDPFGSSGTKHMVVQLIEITTVDTISADENYTVEIEPLFELDFVWISAGSGTVDGVSFTRTGAVGLYAMPTPHFDIIWNFNPIVGVSYPIMYFSHYDFPQKMRNYINNFQFAGILANEQDANPGHNEYVADQDYGAYFVASDMNFNSYSIDDLTNPKRRYEGQPSWKEVVQTILGIGSIFAPPLGFILLEWDLLDLVKDIKLNTLPDERYYNYTSSAFLKYKNSSHDAQTRSPNHPTNPGYGHLIKDVVIRLDNENFALTPLGSETSYAKAMFKISQERKPISANPTVKEDRLWMSRLSVGFKIDIRRYGSNELIDTAKWKKSEVLGKVPSNYKPLETGQATIYNYDKNTSWHTFTAPTAGYYRMYFANSAHDSWYNNFNTSEIYLNANQKHTFALEYKYNNITTSELIIEKADFKFTLINNNTAYSVKGLSNISHVDIPATYRGLPVKQIEANAFSGFNNLQTITIPEGITTIGDSAFYNSTSLTNITIPSSVTSIGTSAFSGCTNLMDITVAPNSQLRTIGISAFNNCTALISITIPADVTYIGSSAFSGCANLMDVTITPDSQLQSMGNSVFLNCTTLTNITIPSSVTSIGTSAFSGCINLTDITFAPNSQLQSMGNSAFYNCTSLTSITIPVNVTNIGSNAFSGCASLMDITFAPNSQLQTMGNSAFYNCTALTNMTIPAGVTSIGSDAFSGCTALTEITFNAAIMSDSSIGANIKRILAKLFPNLKITTDNFLVNNLHTIGASAFYNCTSLTSITIPDSVTNIGSSAFSGCTALTEINFNATNVSYISIGTNIFQNAGQAGSTVTANIGANIQRIPVGLFQNSKITAVNFLGNNVHTIDMSAFYNCRLTNITIPSSVTSIGLNAFSNCTNLTIVTFAPDSQLQSIGNSAFNSTALTNITIPASVTGIGSSAFSGCANLTDIAVAPNSQLQTIGGFSGCISLANIIIPVSVTRIGANAFSGCTNLTNITIPSSVTFIGANAFSGCTNFTNITIPSSVTFIDSEAFLGCTALTEINFNATSPFGTSIGTNIFQNAGQAGSTVTANIGADVQRIPAGLFQNSKVSVVNFLGNNVYSIGASAFYNCTSLTSIAIPISVTFICSEAFSGCTKLTNITIPTSVTLIDYEAFSGCTALTEINFNATNLFDNSIGDSVFQNAGQGAVTLNIGADVQRIPAGLFQNSRITTVFIPAGITSIGSNAFLGCTQLTSIDVDVSNAYYSSIDGVLYSKDETELIKYPDCKFGDTFTIPNDVNIIHDYAFSGCVWLTNVNLTGDVTYVGAYAFFNRGLSCIKTVTITTPVDFALSYNYYIDSTAFHPNIKIYISGNYVAGLKSAWPVYSGKIYPTPVKITYDLQDGCSGWSDYQYIYEYNEYYYLFNLPNKDNYIFAGWFSGPNGTGTQYADHTGCSFSVFTDVEDLTLYAYWIDSVYVNAYEIATKYDLEVFAYLVNSGYNNFFNQLVILTNDIDLDGMEWTPIGNNYFVFQGYFNGNGYIVYNFQITQNYEAAGLFGWTGPNSMIVNLGVENFYIDISGGDNVFAGGIAGKGAVFGNCFAIGEIHASSEYDAMVGGIVGQGSFIVNCYAYCNIYAISNSLSASLSAAAGGIAGSNFSNATVSVITDCYFEGNIYASASFGAMAGGIGGFYFGEISNCNFKGTIFAIANELACAGGIAGYFPVGNISNCNAKGKIIAVANDGACAGGIAGALSGFFTNNFGNINDCYAIVKIFAIANESAYAGGIVGQSWFGGDIINCYAKDAVLAKANEYAYAGGIVGGYLVSDGSISNCYTSCLISARANDYAYAGGIVGYYICPCYNINNCYTESEIIVFANFAFFGEIEGYYSASDVGYRGYNFLEKEKMFNCIKHTNT